jgi:hypothetical protein
VYATVLHVAREVHKKLHLNEIDPLDCRTIQIGIGISAVQRTNESIVSIRRCRKSHLHGCGLGVAAGQRIATLGWQRAWRVVHCRALKA